MKASDVLIGQAFIAAVATSDWRANWKPGKPFPGALLDVSVMTPGKDSSFLRDLLDTHKRLPKGSTGQIDWRQGMWVAGFRETRSKNVQVVDWAVPAPLQEGGQP